MSTLFASSSLFNVEREQFDEIEVEKSFPGWKNWPQDDEDVLNLVGLHVTNYSSVEHTHTHRLPAWRSTKGTTFTALFRIFFPSSHRYYRFSNRICTLTHSRWLTWCTKTHSLTHCFIPSVCVCTGFIYYFLFSLSANRRKKYEDFHFTLGAFRSHFSAN